MFEIMAYLKNKFNYFASLFRIYCWDSAAESIINAI